MTLDVLLTFIMNNAAVTVSMQIISSRPCYLLGTYPKMKLLHHMGILVFKKFVGIYLFLFYLCECVACVSVSAALHAVSMEARRGRLVPGTVVIDGC